MRQKTYAQFLRDGEETLGSDAWFILDGRNNLETQCKDAIERIGKLRRVQKYNGFRIRKGDAPSRSRIIHEVLSIHSSNAKCSREAAQNIHVKLESDLGGKLSLVADLPEEYADLKRWVERMKFGRNNVLAVVAADGVRVKWYTRDDVISVSVRLPGEAREQGYLGGYSSARAPRPGETWTRGNDLADGPYCEETWNAILSDAAGLSALPLEITLSNERDVS